jgi:hypothetical protein
MSIKFTISSRKIGYENTYPIIISSLLENGIPPEDIYFFVGGYDQVNKHITKEGINFIEVDQNSIDYTGLIAVLDLNIESTYWVLLHDTCYIGPLFYDKILNYDYQNAPAVSLNIDLSMNIGAYSWEYLKTIQNDLMSFRNTDYSVESIQKWKILGVENEDKYLSSYRDKYHYSSLPRTQSEPIDLYNTGVFRIIEHFSEIDFYKLKANWYNRDVYELNV